MCVNCFTMCIAFVCRKREAKHHILTKRVNVQIYYIPVTDESIVNSPVSNNPVQNPIVPIM